MFKKRPAFTLVELLIVFAVISALVVGAGLNFSQSYKGLIFKNSVDEALAVFRTARSYATSSHVISGDLPPVGFVLEVETTGVIQFSSSNGNCNDTSGALSPSFTPPSNIAINNTGAATKAIFLVPYGDIVLCAGTAESDESTLKVMLTDTGLALRTRTISLDRVGGIPEID